MVRVSSAASVEQKTKQVAAAPRAVASEMAGYLSRKCGQSSGEAVTGHGDLVADVKAGRQKLAAVKDEDLPDTLRAVTRKRAAGLIDKNMAERKTLNERMAALVKKRDDYVREQPPRLRRPRPICSTARSPKP